MSGHREDIEAEVTLLVQSGVVAEANREKARRILQARHLLLNELSFGTAQNDLDTAREAWERAIAAVHTAHQHHARRLAALEPLRDDPRCRDSWMRLEATVQDFGMACAMLSPPCGPPGAEFMRLDNEIVMSVKQLRQSVGT